MHVSDRWPFLATAFQKETLRVRRAHPGSPIPWSDEQAAKTNSSDRYRTRCRRVRLLLDERFALRFLVAIRGNAFT